jgi:hypothetical protein
MFRPFVRRCCLPTLIIAALSGLLLLNRASTAFDSPRDSLKTPPKARQFLFTYKTTVTGLKSGQVARIWLPVPPSNAEQTVAVVRQMLPEGARSQLDQEAKYNNSILYVEAKADAHGNIPVEMVYRVTRNEVKGDTTGMKEDMAAIEKYLLPDAMVPIGGKPLRLLDGKTLPEDQTELGRFLYDIVDDHMKYSKEGTGWGNGDAEWACDSKFGNCSDFHSLFISLARTKEIPAKFEMGFPLPEARGQGDIGGYHCWAKFKPKGKGWIPVDISEANKNPKMRDYYFGNLTENRIAFSEGRDLTLVPKQDGPALNFFIYPYVECEGKPYPGDKVTRKFSYVDITASR